MAAVDLLRARETDMQKIRRADDGTIIADETDESEHARLFEAESDHCGYFSSAWWRPGYRRLDCRMSWRLALRVFVAVLGLSLQQ